MKLEQKKRKGDWERLGRRWMQQMLVCMSDLVLQMREALVHCILS